MGRLIKGSGGVVTRNGRRSTLGETWEAWLAEPRTVGYLSTMDDSVGLLMLEQLKAIRTEMSGMTAEQRATNERLERLERRQTETEIRLATELVAVAKAIGEVRDLLRDQTDVRLRRCEARLDDLERRSS